MLLGGGEGYGAPQGVNLQSSTICVSRGQQLTFLFVNVWLTEPET